MYYILANMTLGSNETSHPLVLSLEQNDLELLLKLSTERTVFNEGLTNFIVPYPI